MANCTTTPISIVPEKVNCSLIGQNPDPLLSGLGNSDFYWKGNIEIFTMSKIHGADLQLNSGILARVREGKGQWIFCQFEPAMFEHKDYFWLKDTKRYVEQVNKH